MVAPLEGVRVLEVANWLAAPSAAALMADMGADVIKVEPPGGDIYRGFLLQGLGYDFDFATNYAFHLDNRGKRSVTVALDKPGGGELVRRMAADVDVFMHNLLPERTRKYGLTSTSWPPSTRAWSTPTSPATAPTARTPSAPASTTPLSGRVRV